MAVAEAASSPACLLVLGRSVEDTVELAVAVARPIGFADRIGSVDPGAVVAVSETSPRVLIWSAEDAAERLFAAPITNCLLLP